VVHEQAAAFALDALDADETAEFERHLAICPDCEEELSRLRIAAAALAFALDLPVPPPELRLRALDTGAPVIPLRRRQRPQLLLAVAALAAACVAAVVLARPWHDGGSIGGLQRYTAQGADATLLVGPSGEAVLSVGHLPPPPAGKAYEMWVIVGDRTMPAGLLRGSLAALIRPVPPGASVAVSVEPAAGSPRPTGPLLLRAETA
jgi:anti-sigma-K factor RskA